MSVFDNDPLEHQRAGSLSADDNFLSRIWTQMLQEDALLLEKSPFINSQASLEVPENGAKRKAANLGKFNGFNI